MEWASSAALSLFQQEGQGGIGFGLAHAQAMSSILRHESLVAYQRADDLFIALYHLTQSSFPRDERYGLTAQLRRAAYSVPANIVEGFARTHPRERTQFLRIALASLSEVHYCLHAAMRLGFIDQGTHEKLEGELRRVGAPLSGLIKQQSST